MYVRGRVPPLVIKALASLLGLGKPWLLVLYSVNDHCEISCTVKSQVYEFYQECIRFYLCELYELSAVYHP